jgi:hypothetical protein
MAKILDEAWVITDIDESTNEGYGAKRNIYPFDDEFGKDIFITRYNARKRLHFLKYCGTVSHKARVEKAEITVQTI